VQTILQTKLTNSPNYKTKLHMISLYNG